MNNKFTVDDNKLSVIIPCFNEKKFLPQIISKIKNSPIKNIEIILVDDGSTDGTTELIKKHIDNEVDQVIYHPKNLGKGAAIKKAIKLVTGDIVVIQDADLEYDPNEYPKLMQPIIENKADVVFGSRFIGANPHRVHLFWHYLGNKTLTLLSNFFTNLNLTDMETCYKIFRTEIIKDIDIKQKRFGFEPEITAKISRKKCRIYEVGISYYGRSYEEGKKINWKDGIKAIYCILRYGMFD
jgi:glycosyltransferase involved in cell wall biosynthesis